MGIGPVRATKGFATGRFDLAGHRYSRVNEAFAAQSLAVLKDLPIPPEKLNLDGGAMPWAIRWGRQAPGLPGKPPVC